MIGRRGLLGGDVDDEDYLALEVGEGEGFALCVERGEVVDGGVDGGHGGGADGGIEADRYEFRGFKDAGC